MKKFLLLLTVASIVVLDLILSGMNVIFGLILIASTALVSYSLDQARRQSKSAGCPAPAAKPRVSARCDIQLTTD